MHNLDLNFKFMVQSLNARRRTSRKGFSMLKRNILLGCMALLLAAVSSCIFDPPQGGDGPIKKPPLVKLDLSHKTNVLNNIEYSYNKRDSNTYDELLDLAFNFFYTDGDLGGGGVPVQWGRPDELTATSGVYAAASSIDLTIDWRDGVQWLQQVSGTETWYYTTVFYHFTIKIGDTIYIPNSGAKAQFTVRNAAGPGEKEHWQLVEFRDLGGPS
jgi:hypothetical protein